MLEEETEIRGKIAVEYLERVTTWFDKPNARTHPYNTNEGGWDMSPAAVALMDASIVEDYLTQVVPQLMAMAKADGDTWEQIGETMGISKQAAQQRVAAWERAQLDASQ